MLGLATLGQALASDAHASAASSDPPIAHTTSERLAARPASQNIYGGQRAATCEWPTAVAMLKAGDALCTGTLIHPEVVVYAAHCGNTIPAVAFGERRDAPARTVRTAYCRTSSWGGHVGLADWAYCRLAEPVNDVPITPIAMGCEDQLVTEDQPVAVVGFGRDERDTIGVKRWGMTAITQAAPGLVTVGGQGTGACGGDSGGPAFLRLGDGSWRVIGSVSGGGACGDANKYMRLADAVPWIEETSGLDVSPCHDDDGTWAPGEACGGFLLDPIMSSASTWETGCGLLRSGPGASCGEASTEARKHRTIQLDQEEAKDEDDEGKTGAPSHPSEPAMPPSDPGRRTTGDTDAPDDATSPANDEDEGLTSGCQIGTGARPDMLVLVGLCGSFVRPRARRRR